MNAENIDLLLDHLIIVLIMCEEVMHDVKKDLYTEALHIKYGVIFFLKFNNYCTEKYMKTFYTVYAKVTN